MQKLLASLIVCDVVNLFDSLTFPAHMIDKHEEIMQLFEKVSEGRIFKNNINFIYHYSKEGNTYPFWFRQEGASLGEWIVAHYEIQIIECYIQHLLGSKEILRGNFAIEHQKQLRKYWKDLPPNSKEDLVKGAVDEFKEMLSKKVDIEQKRRLKLFNLVRRLGEANSNLSFDVQTDETPSIKEEEIQLLLERSQAYMKELDDTAFIDSLLFPNFEQVGNVTRFVLHPVGRDVYKIVNDLNFKKLIDMFGEKDKEIEIKSKTSKTLSKAGSKVSKAKPSNKKPLSQALSQSKSQSQTGASNGEHTQDLRSDGQKQVEPGFSPHDIQLYSKDHCSGGDSEWQGGKSESGPRRNKKKKSAGCVPTSAVSSKTGYGSESNHNQKAMSMRSQDLDGLEIRRTCSSTNNLKEELTFSNHRTYSTKTESFKFNNRETQTQRNFTSSRVEAEVREEDDLSAEETLSRHSNRGSVDHNQTQTSSVEHKKNLRTGSTEREVKRKGTSKSRAFKQLHLPESQGDSSNQQKLPGGPKDKKECKLVNLYSENMIKEMMKNLETKKTNPPSSTYQVSQKVAPARGPIKPPPLISKQSQGSIGDSSSKLDTLSFVPESPPKLATVEKRKSFNLQNKGEEPSSPGPGPQPTDKTPPSKKDKKQVYSTAIGKNPKRDGEETTIPKRDSNKLSPVTLDFDSPVMSEKVPSSKIDIKAGFQKHLSVAMSREQGELFFKSYLNSHISEFVSKLKASVNAAEPLRKTAFKRVRNVITQSFKTIRSSLIVYGSWVTGLMTESSDIDLCIKRYEIIDRAGIIIILETLENYFKAFKWVVEIKGIYTASVPVLKLAIDPRIDYQELSSQVEEEFRQKFFAKTEEDFQCPANLSPMLTKHLVHVDITVNDLSISENVGLRTTQYIQQSLPYVPYLGEMAILLKTYLASLDLNNAYKGGLGSYAVCLLVIAYLEYRKKSRREDTISDVFWGLLHFYGNEFNPTTHGVCASYGQEGETAIPYFEIPSYLRTSPMMILDPTRIMLNNIAVNAYQIGLIQRHFATASFQIECIKNKFLEELDKEIREHGGVKKDYFLSYHKKKDRALDFNANIIEEILRVSPQIMPLT